VLIEPPALAPRQRFRVANTAEDFQRLAEYLRRTAAPRMVLPEKSGKDKSGNRPSRWSCE
jgi:hypothetical protein